MVATEPAELGLTSETAQRAGELRGKAEPGSQADPLLAPRLSAGQLALLRRYGEVRPTAAGQVLFREGDRDYDFIVILSAAGPSSGRRPRSARAR